MSKENMTAEDIMIFFKTIRELDDTAISHMIVNEFGLSKEYSQQEGGAEK